MAEDIRTRASDLRAIGSALVVGLLGVAAGALAATSVTTGLTARIAGHAAATFEAGPTAGSQAGLASHITATREKGVALRVAATREASFASRIAAFLVVAWSTAVLDAEAFAGTA